MQFGSPVFIVCLTTLVTLVALNLFGVFEVTLGGRTLDAAGNLASRHGASGAFFNGVLATTLATPCTAPFLAPALGFAFSQSAAIIIFIFLTVGLGLASPYVLLSWQSGVAEISAEARRVDGKIQDRHGLPDARDGQSGFQRRRRAITARAFCGSEFFWSSSRSPRGFSANLSSAAANAKGIALAIVLILLAGGYAFALENKLHWRETISESDATGSLQVSPDGIDWQPWSPEAVAQARAAGKPVLVDFTAELVPDVPCHHKTRARKSIPFRAKLKEMNAVALLGRLHAHADEYHR